MKALKILNTVAIGIPIVLAIIGIFNQMFFFYSVLSLSLTGLLQTVIAGLFWFKNRSNRLIPIYFFISILFFLYTFAFKKFDAFDAMEYEFWILPIPLAVYLSFIIYTSGEEKHQA